MVCIHKQLAFHKMNRNIKQSNLLRKKVDNNQLSAIALKCNSILSALTAKQVKNEPSHFLSANVQFRQSLNRSNKECSEFEDYEDQKIQIRDPKDQRDQKDQKEGKPADQLGPVQKRNIYRSRNRKRSSVSQQKVVLKTKITDNSRLLVFFRNQIISLFVTLSKRDEFMNSLRGNKLTLLNTPLKLSQIQERLQKQINGKGKDKTRRNFSHLTNQQLRSLKYKPKPAPLLKRQSKNKNEDEEEDAQEKGEAQDEEDDCPDMATWKRRNSAGFNQKVFIIKGGYKQLRQTLISKGWCENEDHRSPFFDLKWTTKISDINYPSLKNGQIVNHFNNNHHLTSKYGITRRLRSLPLTHNIDIDRFYPRCYDLGDQNEFENFVEGFKFAYVESIAKRFLEEKGKYVNSELKIRTVLKALKKLTMSFGEKVSKINQGEFPVISIQQWEILTETDQLPQQVKAQKILELRQSDPSYNPTKTQQEYFSDLSKDVQKQLEKLKLSDPQHHLNGFKNVWIAKPNFLSRGRGIRCFNNLYEIADYCLGKDVQFVIQKYIQRPLLIQGRKFDIRQWVLIQDYSPIKIYFYEECYFRFSMDNYSLDNIHNRFIHLTNNSVQKYNKKCKIEESMWEMSEFINYVGQEKWQKIQEKIKNIVVWSVKSCEGFVTAKKGSFQLVGFDFMIDQYLNPWLIEINMSPSMDSSTPVTKKLVKMLLHDTGLLISSTKSKKNVGNYTCIFQQDSDLANFTQYVYKE